MCDSGGCFKELDIVVCKQVNSFNVKSTRFCAVTHDDKFLISAIDEENCVLTKWSVRTKKQLHSWESGIDEWVLS